MHQLRTTALLALSSYLAIAFAYPPSSLSARQEPPNDTTLSPAPTGSTEPAKVGKTLNVGIQRRVSCHFEPLFRILCPDVGNQYFFFTTDTGEQPGTICGTLGDGFVNDGIWGNRDGFSNPVWPQGEFPLMLGGKPYTYSGNGTYPGKLVSVEGNIERYCSGDLNQKDPMETVCDKNQGSQRRRRLIACDF